MHILKNRSLFWFFCEKRRNFETNFNRILDVLIELIKNYLSEHRRLVVPQLGAFVVKVPEGDVVFSELLKRDDGVLRGLLVAQGGMNELEAAGAIDRFVFEVRHALEKEGVCHLEGFGRMTLSPGGAIAFHGESQSEIPVISEKGFSATETDARKTRRGEESVGTVNIPVSSSRTTEPKVSMSPQRNPESYVRGLQYGKPLKNMDGYTYVGSKPRRRIDKFVVIAVVVAVLAVAVIVYGYLRRAKVERLEREYMEQVLLESSDGAGFSDPVSEEEPDAGEFVPEQ